MKKILFIAAVSSLAITSCKKDRVCKCTLTPTTGDPSNFEVTYFHSTKADARLLCQSQSSETDATYPYAVKGNKTVCTLK